MSFADPYLRSLTCELPVARGPIYYCVSRCNVEQISLIILFINALLQLYYQLFIDPLNTGNCYANIHASISISSRFSENFEANASKFPENLEDLSPRYCMHCNIRSGFEKNVLPVFKVLIQIQLEMLTNINKNDKHIFLCAH